MEVIAKFKNAPLSAQKGRLVANMIRRMDVYQAINVLKFTPQKGAKFMLKLLHSAISNAENSYGADIEALRLAHVSVDEAPTLKRISARAKGRANRICKRTCHITIKVSDEEK